MFDVSFLRDAGERAVATFAQTLVALVGTDGVGLLDVPLGDSLLAAVAAGVLSLLKSVAASKVPFGDASASAVDLNK
jgi:hypothetical protein